MIDEKLLMRFARPEALAYWSEEKVRFQDQDSNRHVSNVVFLSYIECARVEFRASMLRRFSDGAFGNWVIGASAIRYLRPAFYPGTIRVGTTPIHVGTSSFSLGYGVFQGEECVAVAGSRSVQVDPESGRPTPLPDPFREAMRAIVDTARGAGF